MNKDYIKIYVDNVVCRLPQKDREDVRKELIANIYDMLSANADDVEIKEVLTGLGSPKSLAEKYRTNPRYLISPAVFDNYIKVLAIVVPVVSLLSAFGGFAVALISVIMYNITEISEIMSKIIGSFMSSLFSGAISSAVFITLGFIIYENASTVSEKEKPNSWDIEKLKEVNISATSEGISVIGSGLSILITVCLSIFFMLIAAGIFPSAIWIKHNDLEVYSFFSKQFLKHCLYIIPLPALASVITDILKIKHRKWSKGVIYSVIATNIIFLASFIYLFTRPQMLSGEFIQFLQSLPVESSAIIDALASGKAIGIAAILIAAIISLISCGQSVYKLLKISKQNRA